MTIHRLQVEARRAKKAYKDSLAVKKFWDEKTKQQHSRWIKAKERLRDALQQQQQPNIERQDDANRATTMNHYPGSTSEEEETVETEERRLASNTSTTRTATTTTTTTAAAVKNQGPTTEEMHNEALPNEPTSAVVPHFSASVASALANHSADDFGPTEEASSISNVPVVGQFCCVYYDRVQDFFGNDFHGGWFPAFISGIERSRNSSGGALLRLQLQYHDNTTALIDFDKDVRLLFQDAADPTVYHSVEPDQTLQFFCCIGPEIVRKGDLVFCFFQAGRYEGNPGAAFRGRVSKVYQDENGRSVCDVAYDGGDHEVGIPFGAGFRYLTLLERGSEDATWMNGLTISLPSTTNRSTSMVTQATIVVKPTGSKSIQVQFKLNGAVWLEQRSYDEVVDAVFANCYDEKTSFHWPADATKEQED